MAGPFEHLLEPIPVTVSAGPVAGTTTGGVALIKMVPPPHRHDDGAACIACAAATDIRVRLFDLLEAARQGRRPAFSRVVVDASALPDPAPVIDRLVPGRVPAAGLRDHTVLRSFRLAELVGDLKA